MCPFLAQLYPINNINGHCVSKKLLRTIIICHLYAVKKRPRQRNKSIASSSSSFTYLVCRWNGRSGGFVPLGQPPLELFANSMRPLAFSFFPHSTGTQIYIYGWRLMMDLHFDGRRIDGFDLEIFAFSLSRKLFKLDAARGWAFAVSRRRQGGSRNISLGSDFHSWENQFIGESSICFIEYWQTELDLIKQPRRGLKQGWTSY